MIKVAQIVGITLGVLFELGRFLLAALYRGLILRYAVLVISLFPLKNSPS